MTEVDVLIYELEQERKAFDKLHKRHMKLLKQQGILEKENEELKTLVNFYKYFQKDARELEKENEELKQFKYYETNQVGHTTKGLKIIDKFGNEKCITSIREIIWLLKELNEENKQLKEILWYFKQWFKNKSINEIIVEDCKVIIDD